MNTLFDLSSKVAIVTGGNGGIGLGMALGLAKAGATLVVAGRDTTKNLHAVEQIQTQGGQAISVEVDVQSEASIQALVKQTLVQCGRIDILVNNASAISLTGTLETPMKKYDLMHHVNTRGTYLT